MVTSAVDLYDKLLRATDDQTRARILAEAFEALEERFPNLAETATRRDLSETELRLVKEIEQLRGEFAKETEQIRGEIKETELRLVKQIEQVRAELKETELKLTNEIEQVRAELKETELKLTKEIEQVRADLTKEIEQIRTDLTKEIGQVRVEIAERHASWLRWSFLFWVSQFAGILLILWRIWPQP